MFIVVSSYLIDFENSVLITLMNITSFFSLDVLLLIIIIVFFIDVLLLIMIFFFECSNGYKDVSEHD